MGSTGELYITRNCQLADVAEVSYTMIVLQQVRIVDGNLIVVVFHQDLDFEWLAGLKRENRLSFFLSPDILHLCIANNDFPVVLVEAGVKVEGDIIPFL